MDSDAILTPPTPQELRDAASVLERYNAMVGNETINQPVRASTLRLFSHKVVTGGTPAQAERG